MLNEFLNKLKNKKVITGIIVSIAILILSVIVILDVLRTNKTIKSEYTAFGSFVSSEIEFSKNKSNKKAYKQFESKMQSSLNNLEFNLISWRADSSDVALINKNAGAYVKVSDETAGYLKNILDFSNDCKGSFDITIGEISKLWDVTAENPVIPDKAVIKELLANVGYASVKVVNNQVKIAKGQSLDLGAVGKGIACDLFRSELEKTANIKSATISVGGNLVLFGQKKNGWNVAIRDPRGSQSDYLGVLKLSECFVSTSGDYEKYFEKDGIRYHHIIDPISGYPAHSGPIAVTVVCDSGFLSDALSTACFILGYNESLPLLEKYNAQAVFVYEDMKVYVTDGLKDKFTLQNDKYVLAEQ